MKDRIFVLIMLFKDGSVKSIPFATKKSALTYSTNIDLELEFEDAINLYKSFIEEIPK